MLMAMKIGGKKSTHSHLIDESIGLRRLHS